MAKKTVFVLWSASAVLLVALCALSPSAGIALLPAVCVLAYRLSLRLGAWVPAVAAALSLIAGTLVQGVSVLPVAGGALLASLTVARIVRTKLSHLWEVALCAGAGLLAVCGTIGIWSAAKGMPADELIAASFADLRLDFVWDALSKRYYGTLSAADLGSAPLLPRDELYAVAASDALSLHVLRELEDNVLWYLTGFGAFAGGVGCVGALAWAKASGELPNMPAVKDWRLGRGFLFAAVLPVLAFAFLAFYEPMRPVVRAVVNVGATLPGCLGGITLLYHTLCRCKGKAGVAAKIGFWLIMLAAAVFYEWGILILGFVGLADAVLNVRKWLDWALE